MEALEQRFSVVRVLCCKEMANPQSLCCVQSLSGLLGEKHGLDGKLQQILKLQQLEARFLWKGDLSGTLPELP